MKVTVHFFGPAQRQTNMGSCEVEFDNGSQLHSILKQRFPNLSGTFRLAHHNVFLDENHVFTGGETVDLIPPVSGG